MGSNARGALLALVAFGAYATHDVLVKFLGEVYNPVQIVFFSVAFGFPLATLLLVRDTTMGNLRPVHPWWTALRTGAAVTTAVCAFYAFSVLPLAQTYAILFAQPLLITVLSIPILGEKVGPRRWMAVLAGLVGVVVVLRPGAADLGLGHLAGLTASFGSALTSIIIRKIGREERSVVLMLYPMLANFILMGCLLPFVYQPMPVGDLGMAAGVAAFGFVGALITIAAYKAGEAVVVAPMQYSQILWATAYGYLLFGEVPDGATLLGATIIILSGVYIVLREGGKTSGNQPVLNTRTRFDPGTGARVGALARLTRRGAR